MINVTSVNNMRLSDAYTIKTKTPSKKLMYDAAMGIYNSYSFDGKTIIVCGSGNNAGDGYALANILHDNNKGVDILLLFDKFSEDGKYYYDICLKNNINIINYTNDFNFNSYDTIVDCILGTGFKGDVKDTIKECITKINESNKYVISADINSGLNGDTGITSCAVKSDLTVAIGDFKAGHFLNMAKDYIKSKVSCDIGIDLLEKPYNLVELNDIKPMLKERLNNSNKGSYGYIGLIGGSYQYSGAIKLANIASNSMRAGAGVVMLACPKTLGYSVAPYLLESTLYPLSEDDGHVVFNKDEIDTLMKRVSVIGFGMGITNSLDTKFILEYLIKNYDKKLLIDADGLNALSKMNLNILKESKAKIVLTPHIKEFSRLTGKTIDELKLDEIGYAKSFAKEYNLTLLLKGPTTIITNGDDIYLVDKGCPGMATAGSGDVLSGIISALLGYNDTIFATIAGAYINGLAGELAEKDSSSITMIAGDTANHTKNAIELIMKS